MSLLALGIALLTLAVTPPRPPGSSEGPPLAPHVGRVLPLEAEEELGLTASKRRQIGELKDDGRKRHGKFLSPEQLQRFRQLLKSGPGGRPGRCPTQSATGFLIRSRPWESMVAIFPHSSRPTPAFLPPESFATEDHPDASAGD